jgi:hypothetical protein
VAEVWPCEAYGPEGLEFGALCFMSADERVCASPADCARAMASERRRVFRRINELAASGSETGELLADKFTRPGQLLGGQADEADPT